MLYALRYEKSRPDKVAELRRMAGERFDMNDSLNLVNDLLSFAGAGSRSTTELFGAANLSWLGSIAAKVRPHPPPLASPFTLLLLTTFSDM